MFFCLVVILQKIKILYKEIDFESYIYYSLEIFNYIICHEILVNNSLLNINYFFKIIEFTKLMNKILLKTCETASTGKKFADNRCLYMI